ncbi:MAG: excinuclease ABC subunit UvrC [Oscillospiraceae bacterium]|nr:excinuclease ABC subunit UvrC [Oscillospiraceae bacterium]
MPDTLLKKANNLPQLPGVYIMLDAAGEVIYVGKAKKLKNRVTSYFRGGHPPKVEAMVQKVADFSVIVVDSEFESLVLENSLIKQHQPHYNILLKDDKGYPFIRVDTAEEYPHFELANKVQKDGAKYFGPFGGRSMTKEVIDVVCKALLLPNCGKRFPRDMGKSRPCLNHHMGNCLAWCSGDRSREEYRRLTDEACMILEGRTDTLVGNLMKEMEQAAEELRFEQAAQLRDRIRAVQGLSNKQRVIATAFADTDAVGFVRGVKSCFVVLHFNGGSLIGKDYELIAEPMEPDGEAVSSLVRQYYAQRGGCPKHILMPLETEDREELSRLFTESFGHRVYVELPERGERLKLVSRANLNAREEILRATTVQQRRTGTLEWLEKALELPGYPGRIEAFDISNLGDTGIVAAMTVHKDGRPMKKDYRKFRIRELDVRDDYAGMYQAVLRRFKRYKDMDEKFDSLPDLLLIDGGSTHAAVAEKALSELGISLPVFGMVKDERHRTRALVSAQGREISINTNQGAFSLIGRIQEETHRFAIEYQRSLRNENFASELQKIPGIGEKRKNELLKHFKTIRAIRTAEVTELRAVVPVNTARAIYDYYHGEAEK